MKETPVLMKPEMVIAILDDRKTNTRRILNPQPVVAGTSNLDHFQSWVRSKTNRDGVFIPGTEQEYWIPTSKSGKVGIFKPHQYKCPYGSTGDRLWVKETYGVCWSGGAFDDPVINYRADGKQVSILHGTELMEQWKDFFMRPRKKHWDPDKWKSSIFMPRFLSRITLEVTDVRVESVQDISTSDAISEGINGIMEQRTWYLACGKRHPTPVAAFKALWDSINGKKCPWESNPWVWVIVFKRLD